MSPLLRLAAATAIAALAIGGVAAAPAQRQAYEAQVVSMDVTIQEYEPWRPWEKKTPSSRTVQAVVVPGPALLTTADNIRGATLVTVEKHGRPLREKARIIQVDAEANFALLTVEKPGWYDDLKPAAFAASAPAEGQAETVRWRDGLLEVAASRITRVEVGSSYLGGFRQALLQVETDLSAGGWSEPVFMGGRLVGVTYSQESQRASVIPVDFLRAGVEAMRATGPYRPFANLALTWQENRDPVLARSLSLEGDPTGVLVNRVPWGSSACGALYPRDILLSLDGHAIDAAGYYQHSVYGNVEFTQILADGHRAGDSVPAVVLRGGRKVPVTMRLQPASGLQDLIPTRGAGDPPPYAIEGGLVFRELDGEFLRSWGNDWEKRAPLLLMTRYRLFRTAQTPERRRTVLLAYVLPSSYNIGYGELETIPVSQVNGRPIDSIDDVVDAFAHPDGDFHRVVFEPNFARTEIVLDAALLEKATAEILARYKIPQRSRLRDRPPAAIGDSCPERP